LATGNPEVTGSPLPTPGGFQQPEVDPYQKFLDECDNQIALLKIQQDKEGVSPSDFTGLSGSIVGIAERRCRIAQEQPINVRLNAWEADHESMAQNMANMQITMDGLWDFVESGANGQPPEATAPPGGETVKLPGY